MEVLCPKVSMDFLGAALSTTAPVWLLSSATAVVGGCLFSDDEISPFMAFALRRGTDELDCEPVLMESDSVCTRAAPLSLLLLFSGGGWFLSHVFIIDKPMELLLLFVLSSPPPPAPPPQDGSG